MQAAEFYRALQGKLAGRPLKIQNETDYFASAVAVTLVPKDGELAVLFEVRSAQLAWQPGEICFPGGRIEETDMSPEQTAVRETCEELGLSPGDLSLLGPLDYMVSPIGVILYPYVAYIADPAAIRPSADEVAEIFFVPLRFFLENEPLTAEMEVATRPLPGFPTELISADYSRDWRRRAVYPVLFYHYGPYVIWGLTARVLYSFIEICRELDAEIKKAP